MAKREKQYLKSKSSSTKRKKDNTGGAIIAFFKDGRAAKILGLFLLMLVVFWLFAIISFTSNWHTDYSQVTGKGAGNILFDADIKVANRLGRFGAYFAHLFVFQWFGLASLLMLYYVGGLGLNLLFRKRIFKPIKNFLYLLPITLIAATLLSFITTSGGYPYGGGIGSTIKNYLNGLFGLEGALGFIAFLILVLLVIAYNLNFLGLKSWIKLRKTKKSQETITDDGSIAEGVFNHKHKTELTINEATVGNPVETNPHNPAKEVKEKIGEEDNMVLDIATVKQEVEVEEKVGSLTTPFDPTLDLSGYKFPSIDLLEEHGRGTVEIDRAALERNKDQIIETLSNYNIGIESIKATVGPTVTLYEIVPQKGVRISKIKNLEDDIALSLAALGIRIIAPIPGKGTIGIEVPNENPAIVSMKSVLSSEKYQNTKFQLPIAIGKNIANEVFIADLAKMPHLLMAGATGQGKSVGINAILTSLLYKKHPSQLKFVLVDPKKVELSIYSFIEKHFLARLPNEEECIITDTTKVVATVNALCIEMDDRYALLKNAKCRNINEYNEKFVARKLNPENGHKYLPYIVLVIDEFADLIMTAGKEIETPIARLAQLARAIGIHLIIATQRPSVNVITGIIKANFPARVAFRVSSKIDSRTILDGSGADQLIGRGDMLMAIGSDVTRLQCAFVDTPEVENLSRFIGDQQGYPDPFELPEVVTDEDGGLSKFSLADADAMFKDAAKLIVQSQSGSTSLIQRKMQLGYNRAGRIMDQLEAAGIVGAAKGSKPRDVLILDELELERFLSNLS